MSKARHSSLALGALAAALIAVACQTEPVGAPSFGVKPPPPPKKDEGGCANFRLTGGGRIDERDHTGFAKSTPQSRDFATFGFQARPTKACPPTDGSGQFQWNEHNPDGFGGGFSFHGRVTFFTTPTDETAGDSRCGRFGGSGTLRTRNSGTSENVPFEVNHACDNGEPGVGNDHIKLTISTVYTRHGILSGGNIQQHRLTGNF
ncbi:MAG: hypothetical protein WD773_04045 [Gemmatimonadales bacterium]